MLFTALFVSALAGLGLVSAQTPGACTGSCEGVSHDPSLIQRSSDGTWFRFSTGNGINIATAPDMTGDWTVTGEVVSGGDLWAPDVQEIDGIYYLYYASSTFGTQDSSIGLATSTTMDAGDWTDHGSVFSSTDGDPYNAIDPNMIVVDGINKLNFGSFWDDIYQVQVNSDYTTTTGTPLQLAYNATGTHALEGSYMYYSDPYYFLFFSSGICCSYDTDLPAQGEEYKIMVCRSESALGPFEDADGNECTDSGGTEVLASHDNVYGPGGQGVYEDVLYYHYVDTDIGYADGDKLFGWNTLDFSSGWPVVS